MALDNLITNRVAGSFYNYTDLNRVNAAFVELRDLLAAQAFDIELLGIKTDWTTLDFFKTQDGINYLQSLQNLIQGFYTTAPAPPTTMNSIDFEDANNIEKNLQSMYNLFKGMISNFYYTGEISAGELIGVL